MSWMPPYWPSAAALIICDGARGRGSMQMNAEVGMEHNTTTIVLMLADFENLASTLSEAIKGKPSDTLL